MNKETSDKLNHLDIVLALLLFPVMLFYSYTKVTQVYWIVSWSIMAITYINAKRRSVTTHWPSTIFGAIEVLYLIGVVFNLDKVGLAMTKILNVILIFFVPHLVLYLLVSPKRFLEQIENTKS